MSTPRRVLPGTTYLLTRRCSERRFFLRPSRLVNRVFLYCVAVAAQRTGIEIHAVCVMSNHWHCVLTDVEGRLPEFAHWVHEYVAKCLNASMGRWESFWAPGSYSAVRLETDDDVLDKMAYVLANPVSAGLVRRSRHWPGFHTAKATLGTKLEAKRPGVFFTDNGTTPPAASLQLRPPGRSGMKTPKLEAELRRRVEALEQRAANDLRRAGRRFMGRRRVVQQPRFNAPSSFEPRRGLNPRIACRSKWDRIEAVQRLKQWLAEYRKAFLRFRQGNRDVVFPAGTYAMTERLGARCASAP